MLTTLTSKHIGKFVKVEPIPGLIKGAQPVDFPFWKGSIIGFSETDVDVKLWFGTARTDRIVTVPKSHVSFLYP